MASASVLIVDDDAVVALYIKDQLLRLGYQVPAIATSGEEAIRAICETKPDLVLIDINLRGGIDGIEACCRVPEESRRPVVFMTGFAEEPTLERARLINPYGYLLKPFFERELNTTIRMALERWEADRAARESKQEMARIISSRTEALDAANREIEEQVAERLKVEQTLWQVQKMEVIGQLTSGIAHDFNNLLAVLQGGLEFVEKATADGVTVDPELVEVMLRVTKRGRNLVRRLLTFGRESEQKSELIVVDQIVLEALRLVQRLLGENVEVVTRLDAKGVLVSADANQLSHALLNLALNARDAMPDGGRLTISTGVVLGHWTGGDKARPGSSGEEICIRVMDTGIGMTNEVRRRAFEPFFTNKQNNGAVGLGLTMVQRFVEQSGGRINIDSRLKRGTTVSIHLPLVDMAGPSVPRVVSGDTVDRSSSGKVVLLVEDDADLRVVLTVQLQELGYRVVAVASGDEAIGVIESPSTVDVLLTDIVLPGGVDGFAVAKGAIEARPDIAVLCISGYDISPADRKWLKMQNIELLEKPFPIGKLAEALDAVLVKS